MNRYTVILFMVFLCNCVEDNGNYTYQLIRDLKVANFAYNVRLSPGESHTYTPNLMTKKDEPVEGKDFEWVVNREIVSRERDFTFIASEIGTYKIMVRISDPLTGAIVIGESTIIVNSIYEKGFMILSEKDGNADLAMIRAKWIPGNRDAGINDTIIYDGEYPSIYSVAMEGEKLQGKPYRIREHWACDDYNSVIGEITVMTKDNGKIKTLEINGETMKRETYIEQEFENGVLPQSFNPREVIHTAWDSFILNEDGVIYLRRSAQKIAYHTGYFSADIRYLNGRKFSDLLFTYYPMQNAIFAIEYGADGKRNYIGIQSDYYSATNNLIRLPFIVDETTKSYFTDIQGEILFHDYRLSNIADGDLSVLMKQNGEYILHNFSTNCNSRRSIEIIDNYYKNLTQLQGITTISGMCTSKKFNYVYYSDDHTIYCCEGEYGDLNIVKTFSDRKIVALAEQSNSLTSSAFEMHLAIAFDDGTIEIYEIDSTDPTQIGNHVYTSKQNFGTIKQIVYKLGNDSNFFL